MSHPFSLERNRGLYLGFFFFSNFLIAYSALLPGFKLFLGLFGILLPLYVAIRTSAPLARNEKPLYLTNLKFSIPLWLLLAGIALAIYLRFYKLTTLFCWPTLDEGWNGVLAKNLSLIWDWKFFYTFGDAPPLPVWCAAGLFKLGASSAFALWFPSAVVSLLTVVLGYFAARQFFSRSFALLCGGLLAFSYWPLFIGRFCHQGIWLPLWVCFFLLLWGKFQKAKAGNEKKNWASGLGLGLGFGSFTFTPWIGVAGLLFIWVLWILSRSKQDKPTLPYFIGAFLVSLTPFFLAVIREGYGHHIASLSPWGGWFKEFQFLTNFFKYFAVLVWGAFEKDPAYTPVWGGFLNPLLGAFFFSGIIEMVRLNRLSLIRWTATAFLLFLLPGALSPNLETFRVAQVLPLLLFVVALGAHPFLASLKASGRLWSLVGILAFTGAFDFNQLTKPYRDPEAHPENFGRPLKSLERYRTWQILEQSHEKGSLELGLIDFGPDSLNDPTLSVMVLNFLELPRGRGPIRRVTLSVNADYEPFLKQRFPEATFLWVGKGLHLENGGRLLGSIPYSEKNKKTVGDWLKANLAFSNADLERFTQNSGPLEKPVQAMAAAYPLVQGDPLLESVYWDKMAAYAYENTDYEAQLKCYQMAVTRGYPTADLYYKLGQMYLVGGKMKEAKEAFLKATKAPMDKTPAAKILERMKAMETAQSPSPSR